MNVTTTILRLVRALAACALLGGLVAIAVPASSAAPASTAAAGAGWLRLAHLSPNTPPVDVYLYSFDNPAARVVLRHVSYGTVSPYLPTPAGLYTVDMRSAGAAATAPPVLSTAVRVLAGRAYTVAGMGPLAGLRLQVLSDRLNTPPGRAMVRVIQASMQQHLMTVRAGRDVLARGLRFATITPYRALAPGTRTVRAAGITEQVRARVTVPAGSIHTLVVLDRRGRLKIVDLTDAIGSRVIPVAAPATGFGGTAPRPGSSVAPWLATAAGGLLLTLTGLVGRRRSGRSARLLR